MEKRKCCLARAPHRTDREEGIMKIKSVYDHPKVFELQKKKSVLFLRLCTARHNGESVKVLNLQKEIRCVDMQLIEAVEEAKKEGWVG